MTSANSIQYRMGAGFPGDVNRTHPASIEPGLCDATTPPLFFGLAGIYSSTGTVRSITTGDTVISGIVVRPYPVQQSSAVNFGEADIGTGAPNPGQALDLLKYGYVMVQVNSNPTGIVKGSPVYVWTAATSSPHVQGGFEGTNPSSNGITITGAYFNGPADNNGVTEVVLQP